MNQVFTKVIISNFHQISRMNLNQIISTLERLLSAWFKASINKTDVYMNFSDFSDSAFTSDAKLLHMWIPWIFEFIPSLSAIIMPFRFEKLLRYLFRNYAVCPDIVKIIYGFFWRLIIRSPFNNQIFNFLHYISFSFHESSNFLR